MKEDFDYLHHLSFEKFQHIFMYNLELDGLVLQPDFTALCVQLDQ